MESSYHTLPIQYKDYAVWQQSGRYLESMALQRAFWQDKFENVPGHLQLPTDYSRPALKSYEGAHLPFSVDQELVKHLKQRAEDLDTTLFVVMLSVYNLFLSKICNQQDVTIGTPVSGREHADLEGVMGMFINTLPLRNTVDWQWTFDQLVAQVKASVIAAFDHKMYPFELLLESLDLERDTSRNPLFDVLFSFENFDRDQLHLPGLEITPFDEGHITSKFDLTLTVREHEGAINGYFEYSAKLFREDTISRFASYFRHIIQAVAYRGDINLAAIDIIPPGEKPKFLMTLIVLHWRSRKSIPSMRFLKFRPVQKPEAVAVIFGKEELSYKLLNERSNQLARYLGQTAEKSSMIGIMMPRSVELFVSLLGVLKAGLAYVPIDPEYPAERVQTYH